MNTYAACFRKVINKVKIMNLLLAQMQIMDFIAGLRFELTMIANGTNPADFDEAEEMAKNMKSDSFINKNVLVVTMIPVVAEIKELKAQILELKIKLKESKYILYLERI